ncbi:MAG: hypothetical protein WBV22_02445, partial [Anaerolineaceae bacterium]
LIRSVCRIHHCQYCIQNQSDKHPPNQSGRHHFRPYFLRLNSEGDQVTSILLFFTANLPAYPIYAFPYAIFGGWDNDTLEEVHRVAGLSSIMKLLAWLFRAASRMGARISPLHGRFRIPIRTQAIVEAALLTHERVNLVE